MRIDLRLGVGVEEDEGTEASGVTSMFRKGVDALDLLRVRRGVYRGDSNAALLLTSFVSATSLSESMELSEEELPSEAACVSLFREVA